MADVAALSVISSGVVGVLGALGGFYGQRVTARNEDAKRKEARRDDLRAVLDDAARTAMGFDLPVEDYDKPFRDMAVDLDKMRAEMDRHLGRLGVRLGPASEVYLAYGALRDAVGTLWKAVQTLPDHMTLSSPPAPETWAPISSAAEDVTRRLDRFLGAAANAVGTF